MYSNAWRIANASSSDRPSNFHAAICPVTDVAEAENLSPADDKRSNGIIGLRNGSTLEVADAKESLRHVLISTEVETLPNAGKKRSSTNTSQLTECDMMRSTE